MTDVRVYVPSSPNRLREALAAGSVGPAPLAAHAVTNAVRSELPGEGEEGWEHAVAAAAAQVSLGLIGPDEPARRVVLALDVPEVRAGDPEDPTGVELPDVVPLRRLAAVLADGPDAEQAVARARDSGRERDAEACLDHELGWWAAQEADTLLAYLLGQPPADLGTAREV